MSSPTVTSDTKNGMEAMIDIETMDVLPSAAILSIGACIFDRYGDGVLDSFSVNISLQSNQDEGRTFGAGTLEWWLKQEKAAQEALFEGKVFNLRNAIAQFNVWLTNQEFKITNIWANDPDFDIVILTDAYRSIGALWPYQFWMNRSVRTVSEIAFSEPDELKQAKIACLGDKIHHKAVDDAIAQAKLVQLSFREIRRETQG